ncbi:MAG: ATP-binding protein [Nostocales cyanobacterium LacPavin_0920_SED1_MAG_38_18]|jgi:adenylate kinase|uniref:AAA family ATPase n=1 Tax=Aphanizomenon flos-aquae FACHB-1040 TaxID=2692887 RepID=A0ABR8C0R0_APHFL|nr:ATP-binding protein [Aphanizomenon flos-aquae]MBD2280265.1 AAA family ATPase [Aphanizomenon flos-aquae FACHB-1040]MBO1071741.1 AAA family ATPase [Dolichospermum sp. DEX189]MCX5981602.1 ATP-binding protein [Nostocales cyanobacterium LacPavin_0920_SED1_MAG_38_18]
MMKRQIIFVSGVHGVGKTTLCKKIASRYKIEHFSASNLIAKEKAEEHLQNKQVENITGNQDFLVTAINKYFKNETWYLLDGHFCLLNKNNEITKIPYSTYEGICPRAIILLVDEPENIYTRLNSRDSIKHDLSLLRSFQEQEIDYAHDIKDKLNIPYIMCNPSDSEDKIYTFIEDEITKI